MAYSYNLTPKFEIPEGKKNQNPQETNETDYIQNAVFQTIPLMQAMP